MRKGEMARDSVVLRWGSILLHAAVVFSFARI
jgi:hypothetical protein